MATVHEECVYAALSANQLVGMNADAETLVDRIIDEWDLGGEEVAVWEQRETGAPRLAAVVRRGPAGRPNVTWFPRQHELSVFRGDDEEP